ncbi:MULTISPECIES: AfsR/SARP family transcriptional regulator [unclassified Nonomuraea]|uniref:AfsR/SARP family transcriptional regulator n=1 Tax=unclassified Nonomuraea TaxID=2593643 RepID=UPI00137791FB|nr:BTAD domain-containing putative transcriptional regulator [Nonomuraea sp. KC401]NBE98585.1 tetratricopeptide repeat protein [Nonomuraea sp. K271]
MADLWFGVLGPLDVRARGRRIPLHGPRQERALAALLLNAGHAVTVDRLVDIVWEKPPASARRQIQDLVSRLRLALADAGADSAVITTVRGGYVLRPGAGELDATEFERLVAAAREAEPEHAATVLRKALALWRGEPLSGVDCPALAGDVRTLQEKRLAAWEEWAKLELAARRHHEVIAELTALVERHPLRESLVASLMRASAAAGRAADALEVYHRARERLREELGLDPGTELRNLYERVLRAAEPAPPPVPGPVPGPEPSPEPSSPPVAAFQLPMDAFGFVGRGGELSRLDALLEHAALQPTAVAMAVVSGSGGVGKTTLVTHWAHRVRERFPDGHLHVNLRGFDPGGPMVAPEEAVRGFLSALGVPPQSVPSGLDAQTALYRSVLAGRRMLIVLDNARDAGQVRPLLPGSPGCVVVVTSRDRLPALVAKEGALALPLGLPTSGEARQLLARQLGDERVAAEQDTVDELIAGCGRLPLALAIIAARVAVRPGVPLAAIAEELREAPGVLDALDAGDAATRVRAVFSWSYRILDDDVARMFRMLATHRGPRIGVAAAASLAGVPVRAARTLLERLAGAHLVTEDAPGTYAFHDLMRAYAGELGDLHDPPEERTAARSRLHDHYVHTAEQAAELLDPHQDIAPDGPPPGVHTERHRDLSEALAWFGAEHAALLAAVEDAARSGLDARAWRLAMALYDYLDLHSHLRDQVTVQTIGLEAARRLGDRAGQAHSHRRLGWALRRLDRHDDAHAHLRSALDLYEALDDLRNRAHVHGNLSGVLERQGRYAEAIVHAERALQLYTEAGLRAWQARALNAIGWLHGLLGDYAKSLKYCGEALWMHEESSDRRGQAATWDSLGFAHHRLGSHQQAVACFTRALELLGHVGDRYGKAETLLLLGDAYKAIGEPGESVRAWQEACDILVELNHPDVERALTRLG